MSVITNKQKTLLSKAFIEQGDIVLCIGKNDSWENPYSDGSPEPENSTITSITDAIAYKNLGSGAHEDLIQQSVIAYAKVDVAGDVEYNNTMYSTTTSFSEAYNNDYTCVYLKGTLIRDEIDPAASYRKVGLFINTVGTFGSNGTALPAAIVDPGTLIIVDYRKPMYRSLDQSESIELILPF